MVYPRQLIACLLLILCLLNAAAQNERPTVAELIAEDTRFTVLQRMLELADPTILAYLSDPTAQLTFFAPTNEAMEAIFGETLAQQEYAEVYPDRVNEIIRLHIIPAATDFSFVTYPNCRIVGTMLINTHQYIWVSDGILNVNQQPLPTELVPARNGYIYPIANTLPKLNVVASAGDHTPDDEKRSKPLDPHFGDMYPDAPTAAGRLSAENLLSVLEEDGRFTMFLRLLAATPYQALLESDGLYTVFIPTDTAFLTYFEEVGIDTEALPVDEADKLIAQRIVPGYMTPDYIKLDTMWNGPLELCTVHWLEDVMANGEPLRDMEVIEVDFDENVGLTANGGAHSSSPLYARNGVIYVTEVFAPAPSRG